MEDKSSHTTVLFLLADTGVGHRSAVRAICQAMILLAAESGQVTCRGQCLDVFAACGKFPVRNWSRLYGWAVTHVPRWYGLAFHLTNHPWIFPLLERMLYRQLHGRLAALLWRSRPDIIVCVHPLLGRVTLRVLAESHLHVPFVAVMTDLMTPHRGWTAPDLEHCIVPTEVARAFCRRQGVRDDYIEVLGMPIDSRFGDRQTGKEAASRALGLDPALPVVLMLGGGAPVGKFVRMVRTLWRSDLPAQMLVITGRDQQMRRRLTGMAEGLPDVTRRRTRILGFARNMPQLMAAADVVVTKAGPSTICEAIACELPILLLGCVPGQEEGNVDYVCDHGIGRLVETPAALLQALEECLRPQSALAARMCSNMAELQNPLAAQSIAEYILGVAGVNPKTFSTTGQRTDYQSYEVRPAGL